MENEGPAPRRFSRIALLTLAIAAAAVLAVFLYPALHPWGGMRLDSDREAIQKSAREILTALGVDASRHEVLHAVRGNSAVLDRTYRLYGIREGNRLLRDHVPGYQWKMQVLQQDSGAVHLSFSSQPDEHEIQRMVFGDIALHMTMDKKLIQLWMPVSDSVTLPSVPLPEAYAIARGFLLRFAAPQMLGPLAATGAIPDTGASIFTVGGIRCTSSQQPGRMDHTFSWTSYDEALDDSVDVRTTVSGSTVTDLTHTYRSLVGSEADEATSIIEIFEIVLYTVLVILLAVVGLRRARAYEIGFRSALVLGAAAGILFSVWMAMELSTGLTGPVTIALIILVSALFVAAGMVLLWAVSESVGREVWREKFISFDLLTSGHVLHSRLGSAVLSGIAAGFALLLAALAANALASELDVAVWVLERSQNEHDYLSTNSPALFLLSDVLFSNIAGMALFLLFFVSLLRMRIRSTLLLTAAAGVPLAIADIPNLVPLPGAYIVLLPLMLLVVLLFIRTDLVTTLTALVTLGVLHRALLFVQPWNGALFGEAVFLGVLLVVLIAWAAATQVTSDHVLDFDQIAPRYQRHISERQRLARELDIAREVQMSFLPKHEPVIAGLDIASHCVPALEVGGDYYDFMELGPGRLGIAIGDVSGKGTQAAFYMTLTKGFLKALGSISSSPAEVLRKMNALFYANVERGHFISMIYAVFDMPRRTLTVARAGHSPVMRLRANASVDVIRSKGMALGFDEGGRFSESIEEMEVPLESGDVFVLYTDGYPEAMTRKREEYGEQRLSEALERTAGSDAHSILEHLHRDIRHFTGRTVQHDDMTMVVVRVE